MRGHSLDEKEKKNVYQRQTLIFRVALDWLVWCVELIILKVYLTLNKIWKLGGQGFLKKSSHEYFPLKKTHLFKFAWKTDWHMVKWVNWVSREKLN